MSTFSFTIQAEEELPFVYTLRGYDTLAAFFIRVQLRSEWTESEAHWAYVLGSSFSGIRAGTGIIVTRRRREVAVEDSL